MAMLWSDRQKERGIKLNLTWFAARKCWKKKVEGKVIYLSHPNSANGYQAALLELAQKLQAKLQEFDPQWERKTEYGEIEQTFFGYPESPMETIVRTMRANNLDDKVMSVITGNATESSHSFASQLELFLGLKRSQASSGSRALGTWGELRNDLKVAERFFTSSFQMKNLTGKKITEFYIHLGEAPGRGGKLRLEGRKHNLFRSFGQFVRWYWRQDDTELPATGIKALKNPDLTFAVVTTHSSDDLFTKEDIQSAMALNPRWKAFVLLSLNCSFTQIDIASLKPSQLKKNRLTHKRRKTRRQQNPPTVVYKLWPETVTAIEAAADLSSPDGLMFKTKNGSPLIVDRIIEKDGEMKRQKYDNIGNRWAKLMECGKAPKKPLKFLRKTGRTKLRKGGFGNVAGLYLGHAPQSMGEKYYDVIDGEIFEPLDKATDFLRVALGIKAKR